MSEAFSLISTKTIKISVLFQGRIYFSHLEGSECDLELDLSDLIYFWVWLRQSPDPPSLLSHCLSPVPRCPGRDARTVLLWQSIKHWRTTLQRVLAKWLDALGGCIGQWRKLFFLFSLFSPPNRRNFPASHKSRLCDSWSRMLVGPKWPQKLVRWEGNLAPVGVIEWNGGNEKEQDELVVMFLC